MKPRIHKRYSILLLIIVSWSCSPVPTKEEAGAERKPEIILNIASLNYADFGKRLEERHVNELLKILKQEKIEVLAVQGIVRYPGLASRTDFVNVLSSKADWRSAFGEMMNISGRQTGNAVFSSYPIISQYNQTFENIKAASFEAGLQVAIDAGIRSLIVVSMQLPPKASKEEKMKCLQLAASPRFEKNSSTVVITGNLPSLGTAISTDLFTEVPQFMTTGKGIPAVMLTSNPSFKLLAARSVNTEFGKLAVVQLGLFR
ncbi:MAG: hypothetical protein JXA06_11265 [Bacteroidetes bacterium]|nr:hypothetical protein [Bacteroidota bacterium]